MVKPKWFQRNDTGDSHGTRERGRIKHAWLMRKYSRKVAIPAKATATSSFQQISNDEHPHSLSSKKKKSTSPTFRDESEDDNEICMITQRMESFIGNDEEATGYSSDSPCYQSRTLEKMSLLGAPVRSSTFGKSRKGFHWNILPLPKTRPKSPTETLVVRRPPRRSKRRASDDDFSSSSEEYSEGGKSIVTLVQKTDSMDMDELGSLLTYNADVSAVESNDPSYIALESNDPSYDRSYLTKESNDRSYITNDDDNDVPYDDDDEENSHAAEVRGQQILQAIVPPCIPSDLPQTRRSDLMKLVTMASEDYSMTTASTSRGSSSYDSRAADSIDGCHDTLYDLKTLFFGQCGISGQH